MNSNWGGGGGGGGGGAYQKQQIGVGILTGQSHGRCCSIPERESQVQTGSRGLT